jgi:hypothetical protein
MKTLLTLVLSFFASVLNAQTVAFAADKMNVLYIGVDNPITIVAENTDCSKIKVVINNGTISGNDCRFLARPTTYGTASITATYKLNGKTKYVVCNYRVKEIPPPIFKIGTGQPRMPLVVLKNQQFVRAGDETFTFDEQTTVDSFTVCAFLKDSCIFKEVKNIGSKLSEEVSQLFSKLRPGDSILFKYIYARRRKGENINLEPVMITVY